MLRHNPDKIVLIGSKDATKKFIDAYPAAVPIHCILTDCISYSIIINNNKFEIWDSNDLEDFKNSKAFIYIDADVETINKFESLRDKQNCIAIDFKNFNIPANECLYKIEFLKEHNKNYVNNTSFALWAVKRDDDGKSAFSSLPNELNGIIRSMYFEKDDYYKNSIFYKCPPSHNTQNKKEENNRSCTIL